MKAIGMWIEWPRGGDGFVYAYGQVYFGAQEHRTSDHLDYFLGKDTSYIANYCHHRSWKFGMIWEVE